MPDAREWEEFGRAADGRHKDKRSGVLRDFIRWYLHRPGAELPERPGGPSDPV